MTYLLSKILSQLAYPLATGIVLIAFGGMLLAARRRALGGALFVIGSGLAVDLLDAVFLRRSAELAGRLLPGGGGRNDARGRRYRGLGRWGAGSRTAVVVSGRNVSMKMGHRVG